MLRASDAPIIAPAIFVLNESHFGNAKKSKTEAGKIVIAGMLHRKGRKVIRRSFKNSALPLCSVGLCGEALRLIASLIFLALP